MIASWMTTNQCNLRCAHCYQDAGDRGEDELSTAQAKALIEGIARAGFHIMIFSGGEPLLRPDICELVTHAAGCGLRPVFGTNGTLITPTTAQRLVRAGACAMGISLDSLDEAAHDRFRGSNGAFRRTLEGIGNCRRAGLPFQLHTTVMDWNRDEWERITDFAVEAGAVAHYLFFLVPVGRGTELEAGFLRVEEYEEILRRIMAKQQQTDIELKPTCAPQFTRIAAEMGVETRFSRGCLAGLSYCIVGPTGKVRPCAYMTVEAGDARERDFAEIWRESEVFSLLRTQRYKGACGDCEHRQICGGCRARAAYEHGGDSMAEDSYCSCAMRKE